MSSFKALPAVFIVCMVSSVFPRYGGAQGVDPVSLSGTITDPAGKAIAGAQVTLVGRPDLSARTDAAGHYKLIQSGTALRAPGSAPGAARNGRAFAFGGITFLESGDMGNAWSASGRKSGVPPSGNLEDTHGSRGSLGSQGPRGAKVPLAKAGSVQDSIVVLAIGYQRDGRIVSSLTGTQDFRLKLLAYTGVPYKTGANLSAYEKQMCTLDVHVPAGPVRKYPVIVHLHGGGLQEGDSKEGWSLSDKNDYVRKISDEGFILVCVNYRLGIDPDLPDKGGLRGKFPDYLRDAAASIAWAKRNVEPYGGDTANFFVMGYSAGAWLALMMAMDTTYYHEAGFDARAVSGYIPLSAQTYTYGEYAIEKGITDRGITEAAAMKFVRKTDMPIHLFAGGLETQRISDNNDFVKAMAAAGSSNLEFSVMPGRDHEHIVSTIGNAVDETRTLILEFIRKHSVP